MSKPTYSDVCVALMTARKTNKHETHVFADGVTKGQLEQHVKYILAGKSELAVVESKGAKRRTVTTGKPPS